MFRGVQNVNAVVEAVRPAEPCSSLVSDVLTDVFVTVREQQRE
jgi:hypothetical protein